MNYGYAHVDMATGADQTATGRMLLQQGRLFQDRKAKTKTLVVKDRHNSAVEAFGANIGDRITYKWSPEYGFEPRSITGIGCVMRDITKQELDLWRMLVGINNEQTTGFMQRHKQREAELALKKIDEMIDNHELSLVPLPRPVITPTDPHHRNDELTALMCDGVRTSDAPAVREYLQSPKTDDAFAAIDVPKTKPAIAGLDCIAPMEGFHSKRGSHPF